MTTTDQDRIKGCLYGQAIGDALGLPLEFKSSTLLAKMYPEPPTQYESCDRGASKWEKGEWTDDTEMALAILDSYLEDGMTDTSLAKHFLEWARRDGRGMGNHTWTVISDGVYSLDPRAVSESVWENSGRRMAPNGGVMRTSVIGAINPWDLGWVETAAVMACQTTHYDPRCVASSVAVSITIAKLIQGKDIDEAIEVGLRRGSQYHADAVEWGHKSLEELNLDEGLDAVPRARRVPIGYTWKCMGAGFWALRHFNNFPLRGATTSEKFLWTLQKVLMAGGDADTNGAVAGAMMGAATGFSLIPRSLSTTLRDTQRLDVKLSALYNLQGSQPQATR